MTSEKIISPWKYKDFIRSCTFYRWSSRLFWFKKLIGSMQQKNIDIIRPAIWSIRLVDVFLGTKRVALNAQKLCLWYFLANEQFAWPVVYGPVINSFKISQFISVHFLGFMVDSSLKWKEHLIVLVCSCEKSSSFGLLAITYLGRDARIPLWHPLHLKFFPNHHPHIVCW